MQKYGFYKNGKQRWLLNKEATARTSSQSRSTFYRKNRKLWLIEPNIPITGEVYQAIIIDAQFLSNKTAILIAVTPKFSVSYHWSKGGERTDEYEALLSKLPPSEYIICDGNKAILSVCKRIWPDTRVHVMLPKSQGKTRRVKRLSGTPFHMY